MESNTVKYVNSMYFSVITMITIGNLKLKKKNF
jgi:hypothetical protein